ncbi:MAG: hypothetical protein QW705_05030 [Zestosphaera sp.]
MDLNIGVMFGDALALISTVLMVFLTFRHYVKSTGFRDFTVFMLSLMAATAVSIAIPLNDAPLLPWITALYINGLWLYGVGTEGKGRYRFTVSPTASRILAGVILLTIASWLTVSAYHVGIALMTVLTYILLGTYKLKEFVRV